jgi:electron-transferring-flavoprotein dehydrogenase
VEDGVVTSAHARDGFQHGFVRGMIGMALAGISNGWLVVSGEIPPVHRRLKTQKARQSERMARQAATALVLEDGRPLHDALLSARGWPEIPLDGRLLVSQQDALLMGGKVQAMPGFADHVVFKDLRLCSRCDDHTCVAMCSGQAITLGENGLPTFEREKCGHCGACLWNCGESADGVHGNIEFRAGSGGFHSVEN